jgi:hypothetical protein
MAFTNRCFPTKVVPVWTRPFTEEQHVRVVGTYFRYSACEWEVGVADVSPDGWVGQRDVRWRGDSNAVERCDLPTLVIFQPSRPAKFVSRLRQPMIVVIGRKAA